MKNNFKIHSICLVKNEVDIIEYCLEKASEWSDYIYVYDNGSDDGTWEKVLALQNDRIIPFKQDTKPFQESLRGEIFNNFQHLANPGDWWCRLDADEFYIDSPRQFLAEVNPLNHVVWGLAVEYYLTHEDLNSIDFNEPISTVLSQIRYYKAENSEIRFFKHRNSLTWRKNGQWPDRIGLVYPKRIRYKHYKYRSPQQIDRRLKTRQLARKQGFTGWNHATEIDWHKKLSNRDTLNYDRQNNKYLVDLERIPHHLESFPKRTLKKVMHGIGIWS